MTNLQIHYTDIRYKGVGEIFYSSGPRLSNMSSVRRSSSY